MRRTCESPGAPMPSRRKSPETASPVRVPTPASAGSAQRGGNRRSPPPTDATTKRWRRDVRPRTVRSAVSATASIRWSPSLMKVLVEELYVDDGLEELLGRAPGRLQVRQYPQAVAVALILRHSWRADDLACILERLGLTNGPSVEEIQVGRRHASPKTTRNRVNFSS